MSMPLTELATDWGQTLLQQPTLSVPDTGAWRANAQFAGHALRALLSRMRRTPPSTNGPGAQEFGDDYPMITALYESYQAQCRQQEALATLREDHPGLH
jgi:hypothetical protein